MILSSLFIKKIIYPPRSTISSISHANRTWTVTAATTTATSIKIQARGQTIVISASNLLFERSPKLIAISYHRRHWKFSIHRTTNPSKLFFFFSQNCQKFSLFDKNQQKNHSRQIFFSYVSKIEIFRISYTHSTKTCDYMSGR